MKKAQHKPAIIAPLLIWNQFMKSLSLWRAARNNQRGWFILLAFTNTLGILDIFYIMRGNRPTLARKLYP